MRLLEENIARASKKKAHYHLHRQLECKKRHLCLQKTGLELLAILQVESESETLYLAHWPTEIKEKQMTEVSDNQSLHGANNGAAILQ